MFRQSFAPLLSGFVGASSESAGQFNPPLFPVGNEDPGNGLLGAVGMLLGLLRRNVEGRGSFVENPQLNATMAHMAHVVRTADGLVLGAMRLDPLQMGFGPTERLYETADGWVCVSALTGEEVVAMGRAIGVDVLDDPRFASPAARAEHSYALERCFADAFASCLTSEVIDRAEACGAPVAVPVLARPGPSFLNDEENLASSRVAECAHPVWGSVRELATLIRVTDCGPVVHRGAPALGEHSEEILGWLGYAPETVAELRVRGVVR